MELAGHYISNPIEEVVCLSEHELIPNVLLSYFTWLIAPSAGGTHDSQLLAGELCEKRKEFKINDVAIFLYG